MTFEKTSKYANHVQPRTQVGCPKLIYLLEAVGYVFVDRLHSYVTLLNVLISVTCSRVDVHGGSRA